MPILRLTDGQKWFLLSLPGVRRHEWLLVGEARSQTGWRPRFRDLWNSRDIGRAMDRDWALIDLLTPIPDRVPVPALFSPDFQNPG